MRSKPSLLPNMPRYKSDNKQNSDNYRKISLCRNHRKQFVTLLWSLNAVYLGTYIQKNAQHQKQGYYEKLRNTASYHIFLRILEVLATQISLHHVLVETIHGNHRKDPCQELFKEISLIVHIVKIKTCATYPIGLSSAINRQSPNANR